MKTIDLRSDTVTKPVIAMKQAMLEAELGDDVYGQDAHTYKYKTGGAAFLRQQQLIDFLATKNIIISNAKVIRLVTHLDCSASDIDTVIAAITQFYDDSAK